jgi:hypothetical protein
MGTGFRPPTLMARSKAMCDGMATLLGTGLIATLTNAKRSWLPARSLARLYSFSFPKFDQIANDADRGVSVNVELAGFANT